MGQTFHEVIMDTSSRILLWGYSDEEKEKLDSFLQEISGPPSVEIPENRGYLTVQEILFTDESSGEAFQADGHIVLFFNVPAESIRKIMTETKKKDLPKPIYAMVTRENINWNFNDLVDHLKKEHEFMQKKFREKKH
jgi:hypothetical protein